ncbi:MAG: T9SS type A sorting domain-containing protein [Bacteroidales bacterium]|jgi:hypothetical protein|nr:T9SS type A sorting domain-containing protein [Bacteroidales bacterium]
MKKINLLMLPLFLFQLTTLVAQKNWPQTVYGEPNTWIGMVSPVVADLDNDGIKELVFTTQGNSEGHLSTLFIFEANGNQRAKVDVDYYFDPRTFPSIADIDNDGEIEIVMPCVGTMDNQILIYDSQGILEQSIGIEFQMSDNLYASVVLADVNQDGSLEIIYGGWYIDGARLVVLDNEGNNLPGFPMFLERNNGTCETNTPAVANLDADDELEIVTISHKNNTPSDTTNIRAFNIDGSLLWKQKIFSISLSDPVIGDVNNDGFNEVIFTSENGVYILNHSGQFILNLPLGQDMAHSNIALADFDNDNDLEIVFEYGEQLYVIHHDGTIIITFPSDWIGHHPPVVGDIDNDGTPDILFNSDNEIYALNINGDVLAGFPKPMDLIAYSSPSIGDIDNDGKVDVISSANWIEPDVDVGIIYVWELECDYQQSTMHWPMFQHDTQHTGFYHGGIPVGISEESQAITKPVFLSQNYPNPFNQTTTIKFSVPKTQNVNVRVLDSFGKTVLDLCNEEKSPGTYELNVDGKNLSRGVYYYQLQADNFLETKKFIFIPH